MLRLPAPAKLNLFLRITGQRSDGYHALQTLFQLLDYGDELHFQCREDGAIRLTPEFPDIPLQDNLVIKAARALQAHSGCPLGADIHLVKRLPAGGGLGGGSSDAATTLLGLNQLWQLHLPRRELAALGLQLGADVPLFVQGHTAWAEGIGERLTPVEMPPRWYLVIAPDCRVSTAHIFAQEELTRNAPPITIRAFLEQGAANACQPVVETLYPAVKQAREWLEQFAPARMTGTGACIYAPFDSQEKATAVLAQLPPRWQGFVAKGINRVENAERE